MSTNVLKIGIQIFIRMSACSLPKHNDYKPRFMAVCFLWGIEFEEGDGDSCFTPSQQLSLYYGKAANRVNRCHVQRWRGVGGDKQTRMSFRLLFFPFPPIDFSLSLWEGQTSLISRIKDSSVQNASSYLYVRNRLCPVDGRFVRTSLRRPKQ